MGVSPIFVSFHVGQFSTSLSVGERVPWTTIPSILDLAECTWRCLETTVQRLSWDLNHFWGSLMKTLNFKRVPTKRKQSTTQYFILFKYTLILWNHINCESCDIGMLFICRMTSWYLHWHHMLESMITADVCGLLMPLSILKKSKKSVLIYFITQNDS